MSKAIKTTAVVLIAAIAVIAYDAIEFNHGMSALQEHQEQQDRRATHYGPAF